MIPKPRSATLFLLLAILAAPAATAQAQDVPPVALSAAVRPERVEPGGTVTVLLTVEIAPEHHIYGFDQASALTYSTTMTVTGPGGWEPSGPVRAPAPILHRDETLGGEEVEWFMGTVVFEQDVTAPGDAAGGAATLSVALDYMACTEEFCLDPAKDTVDVTVTVAGEESPAAVPASTSDEATDFNLAGLLGIAWAGVLSILFPCIYPLIPLTVAFFTKHEGSRGSAVFRALLFCLGIIVAFTAIGIAVGPALQALATSLWLNLFLFVLMVVLALSLFGMFDIRLPSSWTDRMQALGGGASAFAPIFMGIAFSLASFTCVVGVIGPILAGTSSTVTQATVSMFAYSVGFALPFFLLALFPMLLSSMPKAGGWMNSLKVMLGFFEVCFAGYYLWRLDLSLGWGIGTYPLILSLWIVTIFLAGLYLLGKLRLPHDTPVERLPVPRLLLAIVFFAFGLFLFAGLMEKADLGSRLRGLLPPKPPPEIAMAGAPTAGGGRVAADEPEDEKFHIGFGGVPWTTDYEHGLATGKELGKRILLNFTGIFCTNCREMETGLLPLPEVRKELEDLVLVELWTDIPNDETGKKYGTHTSKELSRRYQRLRNETYRNAANPYYVVLAPDGTFLRGMGYTQDPEEFVRFLRTGK